MVGYDGHRHVKGSKVHAVTTKESLPVVVTMGPANQHEGRELIPVLVSINIRHEERRESSGRRWR
jgi:hypothetical protein